ncbi:hypothetical protein FRB94_010944 [Tulasnella sp. JGI-2019a]|nr:hypothetical protein FRB93_009763 [Tulasnella sp. JGI-2019a]KAG8993209.1 hypothetical protein FRB94_010944 [Tulasnella sp. JGI-2019a]
MPSVNPTSPSREASGSKLCQFVLPDIIAYFPFPLRQSPFYEAASAESDAWFESYDIHRGQAALDDFRRARFGLVCSRIYSQSNTHAQLRNCCDFMSWLFAFDDLTDDGGLRQNIEGMRKAAYVSMQALRNPKTFRTEFKVGETLRSFWERVCERASEGTQRRFVDTCQMYIDAIYQQVINRKCDQIPSIEEFIELRRDTSAVKLCHALTEYSMDLDLPDVVFEDPIIQSLQEGANDILTWANDLYSFNKEQANGDTQNLVVVVMHELNVDIQGAMDYVGNLIKVRIDQYVKEKHLVKSFGSPEVDGQVSQYLDGLNDSVIGILHWSFDCKRYFGDEHERVKMDRVVTLMPVDTSRLPAPDSTVVEGASEDDTETDTDSSGGSPYSGSPYSGSPMVSCVELTPSCHQIPAIPLLAVSPKRATLSISDWWLFLLALPALALLGSALV